MLLALNTYWRAHPPVHLLLAAFVGFKAKGASPFADTVNDPAEIAALLGMLRPI